MHSKLIRYKFDGPLLKKDASKPLQAEYFGEGADFVESDGRLFVYQLTWQDRVMSAQKTQVHRGLKVGRAHRPTTADQGGLGTGPGLEPPDRDVHL